MASRTARLFARLFDFGVLVAILMPSILASGSPSNFLGEGLVLHFFMGIFFLYLFFADAWGGQSIGKRIMRIAVIEASSRNPCSLFQSLIRNLSIVFFSIVDVLFILSNSKLRLGDRLAGTAVVLEQNLPR